MICVAAMPRSGTSVVTRLLNRCGLDLGPPEQLMPASINNTDGYWENLRFVRLNERLLAASGGTWFAPPQTLNATPAVLEEARNVIAQFEGRGPWGWKDPRNALTLPFWKSLLPSLKVIVCVRHPEETAASLAASTLIPRTWSLYWSATRPESSLRLHRRPSSLAARLWGAARTSASRGEREELVRSVALDLWRISNTRILEATTPAERLVIDYERLLANPRQQLERAVAFTGLPASPALLDEAAGVVSQRMRHQRASERGLAPELRTLYDRLSSEAG